MYVTRYSNGHLRSSSGLFRHFFPIPRFPCGPPFPLLGYSRIEPFRGISDEVWGISGMEIALLECRNVCMLTNNRRFRQPLTFLLLGESVGFLKVYAREMSVCCIESSPLYYYERLARMTWLPFTLARNNPSQIDWIDNVWWWCPIEAYPRSWLRSARLFINKARCAYNIFDIGDVGVILFYYYSVFCLGVEYVYRRCADQLSMIRYIDFY